MAGHNQLNKEKSPYLLQHQHNPVWWQAWSDEAFALAEREGKPVFLSIGYSTCYWCHVMEKDSFEREEVAKVLNEHFVCIKVDREERPDVDQLYMDAVIGLTGHGGWPMSVFLTPDRKPFWGGTFFWKDQFLKILEALRQVWVEDRSKVLVSADQLTDILRERAEKSAAEGQPALDGAILLHAIAEFASSFDATDGGFGSAPKFPPAVQVSLLLRLARRVQDVREKARALCMAESTLDRMARRGLFDQLGGGFHRYSTDAQWVVPHFEKMLYDNALLAVSYLDAFQLTRKPQYESIARATLDYLLRDMRDSNGGFYAAEDAGEVDKEGEFYVWDLAELQRVLSAEQCSYLQSICDISPSGNFEHNHIILVLQDAITLDERESEKFQQVAHLLLAARSQRSRPHRDEKILCAWNGLAMTAFAKAAQVLSDSKYEQAALGIAQFIKEKLWIGSELQRSYCDGEARHHGCLEDYAYVIEGLIALYQTSFDEQILLFAAELQRAQDRLFLDTVKGGYFSTAAKDVIVRKKEIMDGAIPSASAVTIANLQALGIYFAEVSWQQRAEKLLEDLSAPMHRYPTAFPRSLHALDFAIDEHYELAVIALKGGQQESIKRFRREFLPNVLFACGAQGQKSAIPLVNQRTEAQGKLPQYFVCRGQTCNLPTSDVEEVLWQLEQVQPLKALVS